MLTWRHLIMTNTQGEDATMDAFESFVDVLRQRVAAMPPLPTDDAA